ncbi:DUF3613 domain-containing protein [Hydrogenophaga sp. BPS33]|uniref:DUF3613 domain-containing protein n=1 Tax=Hydrogenophaga sp. BPS33 TaxID=2651974 RepID=UPI00132045AE|nr:DUF3613 domain-containing protein [Hydrogenophaga sp. BPS33]QHE86452.1 DUF3613 domain-containing protein [Hydrogenophaga sp. BPS33]
MHKNKRFKPMLRSLFLCAALSGPALLWAQAIPAAPPSGNDPAALPVGDSTRSLLQRQRDGREASATPRPIDGRVAELSHQRHLKSFEHPIPAWFDSRLKGKP